MLDDFAQLEAVLSTAPAGLGFLDRELRFIRVNAALAAGNGFSEEEHLGRRIDEIWPTIPAELKARIAALLDGGAPVVDIEVPSRVDGRERWVLGNYYPIHTSSGGVAGVGIVVTDITRRKRIEDQQTALRRVATLVARGSTPDTLFQVVTEEVATLARTAGATLVRFGDGHGVIVGRVAASSDDPWPVGTPLALDPDSVIGRIDASGKPARIESYDTTPGTMATRMRELGFRAAAGAPVVVAARTWGALLVESTADEPLPVGLEEQLAEFAELIAQALANADAQQELRASRARIVEAADAERRRLERDLHDGAQQRLVTLAVLLRMASDRIESEPAAARTLLQGATEQLEQGLAELRELARGIHPALLMEHGLSPALSSLADRAPLPVRLAKLPSERLPAPIEAAAYFVVAEALTNVAKYANATCVDVSVTPSNGTVCVEVVDDGVGGADIARGSGLRGLADRVEALAGRLEVESVPGAGTTVRALLPSG